MANLGPSPLVEVCHGSGHYSHEKIWVRFHRPPDSNPEQLGGKHERWLRTVPSLWTWNLYQPTITQKLMAHVVVEECCNSKQSLKILSSTSGNLEKWNGFKISSFGKKNPHWLSINYFDDFANINFWINRDIKALIYCGKKKCNNHNSSWESIADQSERTLWHLVNLPQ